MHKTCQIMNMDKNFEIAIDSADNLDNTIILDAIQTHLPHLDIAKLKITSNMIGNPPYRVGHILDIIESQVFKKKFQNVVRYKSYELNWVNSKLSINDKSFDLSERERDLMIELLNAGDKGCSRDILLSKIWGYKAQPGILGDILRPRGFFSNQGDHGRHPQCQTGQRIMFLEHDIL